ncbi:hypothetical protein GUITHDRAFT_116968 [Guillardia theta CCMP2712]|uniref:Uncharacterized protein n=1 Tax=Guillardia theta (strain CCMP2712) TaxID=905079 RepID=L1ILQ5_GUITC|nr:hypothetical protein GUITHDRAFT_116968 [Guillardia theta CCMP2712]EKX36799.1 hypothetical protein GUITHDRAFT_116968 [Guillardia theta CCMP2712]|eukprot:XP_005823779.1 hypothetical protein GUITHDRAFT_116968 [Guillardia theta CCMP2712]
MLSRVDCGGGQFLEIRHRSITVEPADSRLFRCMGAALWPSSLACVREISRNESMRKAAVAGGSLLELGSGHGLGGIASCLLGSWTSDERLLRQIEHNCRLNRDKLNHCKDNLFVAHLVWKHDVHTCPPRTRRLTFLQEGVKRLRDCGHQEGCTYSKPVTDALLDTIKELLARGGVAVLIHATKNGCPFYSGWGIKEIKRNHKPAGFWKGSRGTDHLTTEELVELAEASGFRADILGMHSDLLDRGMEEIDISHVKSTLPGIQVVELRHL